MPGSRRNITRDPSSRTFPGDYIPVSARVARFGLVLGQANSPLVRLMANEENDEGESVTRLAFEHIVLLLSRFPYGHSRIAATLEVFFDFLVSHGVLRMEWSSSSSAQDWRSSVSVLCHSTRDSWSPHLIPPLACEMMVIIFLGANDSVTRRRLFDI